MQKRIKSNEATKVKRQKKQALFTILDLGQFYSGKNLFKLVKWIEGFETKLQALESPDSDKRAKSYTKTKIESGIAIRKIADLIREKEKRRTFARTNGRTNAH